MMQTTTSQRRTDGRRLKAKVSALALIAALAAAPLAVAIPAYARPAPDGFADLIDRAGPAVVQITIRQTIAADGAAGGKPPFEVPEQFRDGPFRDFFERFFREGVPGAPANPHARRAALGSGFLISSDGVVVTNNHVVGEAETMEVTMKDGSRFPARLLGSDEKTDLAVLKIDADRPLPTVTWGDSDATRVGDWVVAVGNPFGLSGTASAGIVSSRGRDIGAGPYDDFIQIDAPINTGNSGGPLFDGDGKVIGVNTAIFSPTGGSIGIGFAIPSNAARKVVAELQESGSVRRGWLGVAIQPVTPDVAESLGLNKAVGALVASVSPDGPAAQADLRTGDVVIDFDGKSVVTPRELSRAVADAEIGGKRKLVVWRQGREQKLEVRIGEMSRQLASADHHDAGSSAQTANGGVALSALGLTLAPLDDGIRSRFGLPDKATGAVVASVERNADAAEKGLQPGDLITRVNQDAVNSPSDVVGAVEKAKSAHRKSVLLLIERGGNQHFVAVDLASA